MATGLDLPADMTTEDIEKLVDKLVNEDHAEREEEAAAAEKIVDDQAAATTTKTPTKTPAGEESSAGKETAEAAKAPEEDKAGETKEADGEGQGDEEAADRTWFDDDLKAEVSAAGFDEDQFAEFASRDEVERALNLMDLQAMQHGRQAESEDKEKVDGQKTPAGETSRPASKTPPETSADADAAFEVGIEEFEEPVRDAFSRLAKHFEQRLEQRIAGLEAAEQGRADAATEERFDAIVDSLGHKDLFGETGKETPGQLKHRRQLLDSQRVLQAGLLATGRKAVLDKALVGRALRLEFADHISKSERKALTRKVKAQSDKKSGIGSSRPEDRDGGETTEEMADRRYRELDKG